MKNILRKIAFTTTIFALSFTFTACNDSSTDATEKDTPASSSEISSESSADTATSESSSSVIDGSVYDNESSTLTDLRDNHIYKTVTIGGQTWMAENLNFKYEHEAGQYDSFCYKNDPDSCAFYGRYYTWDGAMDSDGIYGKKGKGCGYGFICNPSGIIRGVCPEGWHLPSVNEWNSLFDYVGGIERAGHRLKSEKGGWKGADKPQDSFGFSAIATGYKETNGSFGNLEIKAYFWSSTEDEKFTAYEVEFSGNFDAAELDTGNKSNGMSVRCLKDL